MSTGGRWTLRWLRIYTNFPKDMKQLTRTFFFFICAAQLFFAAAFFWQVPFAVRLWPFEGTTPLTFIFLASFFAAAAASTFWAVANRQDGALAGIALDYMLIFVPLAYLGFQRGASTGNAQMIGVGVKALLGAIFGVGLFLWSVRMPMDATPPLPRPLRMAFMLFIGTLVLVSGLLIFEVPNIIPWKITPDLSLLIGWMFMGAASYFVYGLLKPRWANAAGQMAGFLAYDLVLIGPFLSRLPTIAPEFRTGMIVYLIIIVGSGALALYYLFIHPETRVWGQPRRIRTRHNPLH